MSADSIEAFGSFFNRRSSMHARARQRSRGISDLQVQLLRLFGEEFEQKGDKTVLRIPEEKRLQLRHALDRMSGQIALLSSDGVEVTHMHTTAKSKKMYRNQ